MISSLRSLILVCLLPLCASAADFKVGDPVEVLWSGTWYKAKVTALEGGKWKISYEGYGSSWDEVVGPERIRARPAPTAAAAGGKSAAPAPKTYAFPERPAGKKAGLEGAYLRVESWYFNGSLSLTNQGWFFTKEGRVALTPAGGFHADEFRRSTSARKSDGVYWIEGEKLTIQWADGSKPRTYTFTDVKKDEMKLDGIGATRVDGFKKGFRLDAYYEGGASARGGGSFVASSNSLRFKKDGTFEGGAIGSVSASTSAGTVGGGSSSSSEGTYEFDGYTLTLKHADGREEKRTVFAFSDKDAQGRPEYIWREGTMLRRRD